MSYRSEQTASRDLGGSLGASTGSALDQMIRWPFWMAGATMDLMLQGMQRAMGPLNWTFGSDGPGGGGGSDSRGNSDWGARAGDWTTWTGQNQSQSRGRSQSSTNSGNGEDQDLSGDDLKYVVWSILFSKPGYEAVLEPQQTELVNYSSDGNSFAAMKIAKFLEKARNGRSERPALWTEKAYPADATPPSRRAEGNIISSGTERGWRIPADDQKYIRFVYRVDRRLPKEELEVTHIERVTIERGTESRSSVAS